MYTPTEEESQILSIIENEKNAWEDGSVWVTDRVQMVMKNVIKKARKNYFGIFNNDTDPATGRKKLFIPLTEWTVETVVKNIDLDTKDIKAMAKNGDYKTSALFRLILRHVLDDVRFGSILNKLLRMVGIDGTSILKAYLDTVKGKKKVKIRVIDSLNLISDPSAETLDDSSGIIERNILTLPEFSAYKFKNSEYVTGETTLERTGFDRVGETRSEIPYVEVIERYGYLENKLIGEPGDGYTYCLVIISGLGSNAIVHEIRKVATHPYQEFKFKEVLNRFHGRGIGEMLFSVQAYVNEIINTRLNTNRVAQMGLWEIRGNITPQQLKKLFQTSAIKTNQEGDITRLDTKGVDATSYQDEQNAYAWGQRVTQAQREDEVSANKPATNALIEERGSNKAYELVMEGIMLNMSKFIEEKVVPLINQTLTDKEVLNITGDPGELMKIQEPFVRNAVYSKLVEQYGTNIPLTPEEILLQIDTINKRLAESGSMRTMQYAKKVFNTEYAINIEPKDEQINSTIMANQLVQVIGILSGAGVSTIEPLKELFELMGLDADKLTSQMNQPQQPTDQVSSPAKTESNQMPLPAQNMESASRLAQV